MKQNYYPSDEIDVWEAENSFYLRSHPTRLAKLLAQYEIYKRIVGLPGAVIECGVYKGSSLCRFACFRALLENDFSRTIYGLDAFGEFPSEGIDSESDQDFIERFEKTSGAGIAKEALEQLLAAKPHSNIKLIKGNILETVPMLVQREPHLRIALLHLDLDVYEPTKACLKHLFSHMSPGGLVVF